MPSIKQIQSRLLNKKNSLGKTNSDILSAEKWKNNINLKRLNQDRASLDRDIKKLERQLALEIKASREKKDNPAL